MPVEVPQASPVAEITPALSTWTHWVPDPAKLERVKPPKVGAAVVLTDWSNQSFNVTLPFKVMVLLASPVATVKVLLAVRLDPEARTMKWEASVSAISKPELSKDNVPKTTFEVVVKCCPVLKAS